MAATITFNVMGTVFKKDNTISSNKQKHKNVCFYTGLAPLTINQQPAEVEV